MGRIKVNLWSIAASIGLVIGLFGPWLSKSYDSYGVFNPKTGVVEWYYHSKIELSPFFGSTFKDDQLVSTTWFINPYTSTAGALLMSAAALCVFRFNRRWINFLISTSSFSGVILFFISLGTGVLGSATNLEWGLWVTIMGLILLSALSLVRIIRQD